MELVAVTDCFTDVIFNVRLVHLLLSKVPMSGPERERASTNRLARERGHSVAVFQSDRARFWLFRLCRGWLHRRCTVESSHISHFCLHQVRQTQKNQKN